jgi:hypothetical protein
MPNMSMIKLELAREPDHPHGDRDHGYVLRLPLTSDGSIDADAYRKNPALCSILRQRPGEAAIRGRVVHGPGGRWSFDYDDTTANDDEAGFRLSEERFVPGEYVSIREDDGKLHTFQVVFVRPV